MRLDDKIICLTVLPLSSSSFSTMYVKKGSVGGLIVKRKKKGKNDGRERGRDRERGREREKDRSELQGNQMQKETGWRRVRERKRKREGDQ